MNININTNDKRKMSDGEVYTKCTEVIYETSLAKYKFSSPGRLYNAFTEYEHFGRGVSFTNHSDFTYCKTSRRVLKDRVMGAVMANNLLSYAGHFGDTNKISEGISLYEDDKYKYTFGMADWLDRVNVEKNKTRDMSRSMMLIAEVVYCKITRRYIKIRIVDKDAINSILKLINH